MAPVVAVGAVAPALSRCGIGPKRRSMAGEVLDNKGRGEGGWNLPAIHPDGRRFGLIAAGISLAVLLFTGWGWLGWPMLFASAGVFAFFRDPERIVPQGEDLVLAAADGIVTQIVMVEPPRELQGTEARGRAGLPAVPVIRVSTFLSVFDVHINRAPIGGLIERSVYVPGEFANAEMDKASESNERQHVLIARGDGTRIAYTQIAGLLARRIVPFVKPGDMVAAGQRVGLIRFGSRVDIYLPPGTAAAVVAGQRMVAGETVLARLGQDELIEGIAL